VPFAFAPLAAEPWSVQRILLALVAVAVGSGFVWMVSVLNIEGLYRALGRDPYSATTYPRVLWAYRVFGFLLMVPLAWGIVAGRR